MFLNGLSCFPDRDSLSLFGTVMELGQETFQYFDFISGEYAFRHIQEVCRVF